MNRLETMDQKLAASLRAAAPQKRVVAVLAGCEYAVNVTGIRHPTVDASLELLRHEGKITLPMKAQLDELTSKLDKEYFAFQNQESPDAIRLFGQARTASALSFAFALPSLEAACESLYEVSVTVDNPATLLERVRQALD